MKGDDCPVLQFLERGEKAYEASRKGLRALLARAASNSLQGFPALLMHEVDKDHGIYEFIKGNLRLLFFKGEDGELVVCTGGYIKKSSKIDKHMVAAAVQAQKEYLEAKKSGKIVIVD